jgi:prevent-host-death family protein
MVMETTSLANVKAHLSTFVSRVHDTHERVMITRNGEPAAILISPDDLEALENTLEVLGDPESMAAIAEARDPQTPSIGGDELVARFEARKRTDQAGKA